MKTKIKIALGLVLLGVSLLYFKYIFAFLLIGGGLYLGIKFTKKEKK